jgi:hypothetical protein
MDKTSKFSLSILKAFGIPPDKLETATRHLSQIILANFLELVGEKASPQERELLVKSLYQFDTNPDLFSRAVSEVMTNNQELQERTAEMINNLYTELVGTFHAHASPEEEGRFKKWMATEEPDRLWS